MLNHRTEPSIAVTAADAIDSWVNAQVEDYLDRIWAPLVEVVPYDERAARRAEMRGQIRAVVEAHLELGDSPEAALRSALRQFGGSEAVALSSEESVAATTRPVRKDRRQSLRVALRCFGAASIVTLLPLLVNVELINFASGAWTLILLIAGLPLLAGAAVGLLARERPIRSVLMAVGMLTLPAALVCGLVGMRVYPFAAGATFAVVQAVGSMFFGSAGARAGSWVRTKLQNLRRRLSRSRAAS